MIMNVMKPLRSINYWEDLKAIYSQSLKERNVDLNRGESDLSESKNLRRTLTCLTPHNRESSIKKID